MNGHLLAYLAEVGNRTACSFKTIWRRTIGILTCCTVLREKRILYAYALGGI